MHRGLRDDGRDVVAIVHGEHTAEGVGAEVLDEGLCECVAIREQEPFEIDGVGERPAVGQHAGWIDRGIVADPLGQLLVGSPPADRVVIIECQAERVDLRMAGGAGGVAAVRGQLVAERGLLAIGRRGLDRLDVRRWGRGRPAEDRLAQPDATVHRTMPPAVGGEPENRPHRE